MYDYACSEVGEVNLVHAKYTSESKQKVLLVHFRLIQCYDYLQDFIYLVRLTVFYIYKRKNHFNEMKGM